MGALQPGELEMAAQVAERPAPIEAAARERKPDRSPAAPSHVTPLTPLRSANERLLAGFLLAGLSALAGLPASSGPAFGQHSAETAGDVDQAAELAVVAGELPDLECLRLMRRARIAELSAQPAAEVAWLKQAREECNEPTAALVGLLRADRRSPLPEAETQEYRRQLIAAIDDPASAPPPGVLEFIARSEEADDTVLRAAFGLVERLLGSGGKDRARLLRLKALLDQRLGRPAEATTALVELRSLEPASEEIAWALLRLLILQQRWGAVADLLGEMAEDGGPSIRSLYARALARAGRVDEANRQLELLGDEIDPNDGLALSDYAADVLAAAWNLRDAGRLADAESLFRLAERHAPPTSWARVESRGALVHLYGTAEERAAHERAAANRWRYVTDPQSLLNEGANQLSAGNFDQAIELLKRAAGELGHFEAVWHNLGFAAYRAERWEEAFQALDRAAELNDRRADNFFFSGLALVELERWEEAIPRLLRTVELDPERRLAHYNLWVCYRVLGREREAARHQAAYDALGDR